LVQWGAGQCKLHCGANKALAPHTSDTGLAQCALQTCNAFCKLSSAQLRVCLMSCMSLPCEGLSSFDIPRAGEMRHIQAHHTAPGSMTPSCHSRQPQGCTCHWEHQRVQGLWSKHRTTAMHIRRIEDWVHSQADGVAPQNSCGGLRAATWPGNARSTGSVLIFVGADTENTICD
jgi:hypothetical protein